LASLAFASPQEQKNQDKKTQEKQSGDDDKFYHGKGINDLNAIGNRNVAASAVLGTGTRWTPM
jgi:hypothetical protein